MAAELLNKSDVRRKTNCAQPVLTYHPAAMAVFHSTLMLLNFYHKFYGRRFCCFIRVFLHRSFYTDQHFEGINYILITNDELIIIYS
jgi:hypothetical protein